MDQLAAISDGNLGGDTIGLSFGASGKMEQIRHMNATQSVFSYNSSTGQLASIQHKRSDESSILSLAYSYDPRNNITQKVIDSVPTNYTYDYKDQLTGVQVGATTTEQYTYDPVGNRLSSLEASTWTYNEANQLTSYSGGHSFAYDDNGNMTQMSGSTTENLTYSVDDRLSEYAKGTTSANYYYDYTALRVKKNVNGVKTYFIYDGTVLLKEITYNSGGQITDERYYTFMAGNYYPLAMNVISGATINSYAYHNDHLMTPLRLTASDQSIAWGGDYKAFGEVTLTASSVLNSLRFPGQLDDGGILYFNHNRYFIPRIAIYNRKDPLREYFQSIDSFTTGQKNGLRNFYNRVVYLNSPSYAYFYGSYFISYNYSYSNPTRYFDPDGLSGKGIKGFLDKHGLNWPPFEWPPSECEAACHGTFLVICAGVHITTGPIGFVCDAVWGLACWQICSDECPQDDCMNKYNCWCRPLWGESRESRRESGCTYGKKGMY